MNSKFSEKLANAVQNSQAFVLFRKPNEAAVYLYVQDYSQSNRFLMHSFDSKTKKIISDENPAFISSEEFQFDFQLNLNSAPEFLPKKQKEYEELIQKTIETIQNSSIQKIVISRIKQIENKEFSLFKSYKNLLGNHPGALVYLWQNPGQETWLGATPELLLSQNEDQIKTVSLAGTKLPEKTWTEKELDEQKIVTDFILTNLSGVLNLQLKGPETVPAGKFQHLKTYISAEIPKDFDLDNLLKKLHPTPAVCGLPKKEAFDFILENEGYDRGFYAGYLGIDSPRRTKEYFVNLRSAEFFQNQVRIYVGGGVTAESNPQKEWEETELKSGTVGNSLTQ